MKISFVELFLKGSSIGIIAISLYGLLLQFIFSYFNQSIYGPHLTLINFAGPFLLTIAILLITGYRILFKKINSKIYSFNNTARIILTISLCSLLIWQVWHILTLYNMNSSLSASRIAKELLPMLTGLCATLIFIISVNRRVRTS